MSNSDRETSPGAALAGIVLLAVIAVVSFVIFSSTKDHVTDVVVTDKERVTTGETSRYLIFTDREVFETSDSLFAMKFNSSDVYGSIQRGQTCSFDVTGLRIPFLSTYRNILKADCRNGGGA